MFSFISECPFLLVSLSLSILSLLADFSQRIQSRRPFSPFRIRRAHWRRVCWRGQFTADIYYNIKKCFDLCNSYIQNSMSLISEASVFSNCPSFSAASKALNKLTMADLKFLFDLDGEQKRKEQMDEAAKKAVRN